MIGRTARTAFALLALSWLTVAAPALADEQAELEKARAAYVGKNFAEAEERFVALLDPKSSAAIKDPALVAQARMYWGAVLLARGKRDEAALAFERLLLDDAQFEPDPLSFPSDVINVFIDTRAKIRDRLNAAAQAAARLEAERRAREEAERKRQVAYLAAVEAQAQDEKITVRHQRLVAMIPFGAGQFQNGQNALGWFFLGTESLFVAGTAVTLPLYVNAASRANEETALGDPEKKAAAYKDRRDVVRTVDLSLVGAFGAFAVIGIVQAQLGFVDETTERKKRSLPVVTSVTPFGISGTF